MVSIPLRVIRPMPVGGFLSTGDWSERLNPSQGDSADASVDKEDDDDDTGSLNPSQGDSADARRRGACHLVKHPGLNPSQGDSADARCYNNSTGEYSSLSQSLSG